MNSPTQPSNPCPYHPFDVPCMKEYGHGSPHMIVVEEPVVAAFIDKVDKTARSYVQKQAGKGIDLLLQALEDEYGAISDEARARAQAIVWPK